MRTFLLPAVLLTLSCLSAGARQVTVEQLEQELAASRNVPDAKLAKQICGLELTERVTSTRFARWQAEFSGNHTREALLQVADAAAFFDLPAADVVPDAKPALAAQKQMLSRAVDYVAETIPMLPNFSALRTTMHFEDTPPKQQLEGAGASTSGSAIRSVRSGTFTSVESDYKPLHSTGRSSAMVAYRDGREVEDTSAGKSKKQQLSGLGFTTSGEFGPILTTIFSDAPHGTVAWSHWERGKDAPEAVFYYAVPQESSHYTVVFSADAKAESFHPAYHGEIALDPASGNILRLSVVSQIDAARETGIQVEYGPVDLGGKTYLCPVRSVALSRAPLPALDARNGGAPGPQQIRLNDVTFTGYHLFRGDVQIVKDDAPATGDAGAAPPR